MPWLNVTLELDSNLAEKVNRGLKYARRYVEAKEREIALLEKEINEDNNRPKGPP